MLRNQRTYVLFALAALHMVVQGRENADYVVAKNGSGNFTSIQNALDAIPARNAKQVMILIRNGVYEEKVFVQRSYVTLVGEHRDSTRIVFPVLREEWHRDHPGSDWGAAVVNIDSTVTDFTLANLTVYNNYGWKHGVFNKHQCAIRGDGTRIMLLHCTIKSDGGDALSLWNKRNGMYYHYDCDFEGWVDYVCPRGWCYITSSRFFGHNLSASLWHDGDYDKSQKFVITNSHFDGVPGFPLGRHHRDGQFYLIDCTFSEHMADRPIYYPSESPSAKPWVWGRRHYYYGCEREGGNYSWFRDNVHEANQSPTANMITARWTFNAQWDPEGTMTPTLPYASLPSPAANEKRVASDGVRLRWLAGRNAKSHNVFFGEMDPPESRGNQQRTSFDVGSLPPNKTYFWRIDEVTSDGIVEGKLWRFETQ